MLKRLYPAEYIDSVYDMDFKKYYNAGFRGIIFDIDNTIVPHGAPADERAVELFCRIRSEGFDTCAISNNKEPRVKPFAEAVGTKYVYDAHKPSVKNYIRAMELMNTSKQQTIFIGDQLFTDVWGANRAGIYSVLVKPIHPKEEIQIVFKRRLERPILWWWRKKYSNKKIWKHY